MQTIPIELPLSAAEGATFAELLLDHLDHRLLTDDARNRLAIRVAALQLSSFTIHPGSIVKDPIHPSTYYVAADARDSSILLRVALASSPSSGLFPKAVLIGRMRTVSGREIVVNAARFGPADHDNLRTFAERVDTSFLPRPQGGLPAIAVQCSNAVAALPVAFHAFRAVLKRLSVNVAAVHARNDYENFYHAALWAAIRSGWREGYTIGAEIDASTDVSALAAYTRFTVRANSCSFEEVEGMYDSILQVKAPRTSWRKFDFEVPDEECLEHLKAAGRPAQAPRSDLRVSIDGMSAEEIATEILARGGALRA
jgi:hypothetical protein